MPDDISFALVLNLHQPAGNLERLLADNEWEASEILWALDRIPRSLWPHEDLARVHLSLSGTLLETLANPEFQRRVYGTVDCGSLLWHLQNTRIIEVLGTGYYHPVLPLVPPGDWDEQLGRWHGIGRHRVLQQVDPDELDRVVGGWLAAQQPPAATDEGPGAVAVDGKTLRGARQADGHQVQLFAALAHGSGTVLGQRQVPATTNETTQVRSLLEGLDLAGRVVTADALHTLADHARFLVEDKGADYVFAVKGNQPGLETAINRLPSAAFPPPRTETDRGHGRIERRTIRTAPVPAGVRFPDAAQVLELQRHTTDLTGGALRTEVAYGITSLAAARAGPARLGALVRGHWEIENTLHWVRDVTFDEDRSQVRTGHGPQVMASLRNLAIGRLRLAGHRNIARGLRWAGRDPSRAFGLLGV